MAGESVINGVTKIVIEGGFSYLFPIANIITNTANDTITYKYFTVGNAPTLVVPFADITEKYGASDAQAYVDELARIGAFFLPNSGSSSSSSSATSQAIDLTQLTSLYESLNIELLQAIKKNTDDMVFLLKAIAE